MDNEYEARARARATAFYDRFARGSATLKALQKEISEDLLRETEIDPEVQSGIDSDDILHAANRKIATSSDKNERAKSGDKTGSENPTIDRILSGSRSTQGITRDVESNTDSISDTNRNVRKDGSSTKLSPTPTKRTQNPSAKIGQGMPKEGPFGPQAQECSLESSADGILMRKNEMTTQIGRVRVLPDSTEINSQQQAANRHQQKYQKFLQGASDHLQHVDSSTFACQMNKKAENMHTECPHASPKDIALAAFTNTLFQDSCGHPHPLYSYYDGGHLAVYHDKNHTKKVCISDAAVQELSDEKHQWACLAITGVIEAASDKSNVKKKYKKSSKPSLKYPTHRKRYNGIAHIQRGGDAITGDCFWRVASNFARKVYSGSRRLFKKEKLTENKLLSRFSIHHERELHIVSSSKARFCRKGAESDSDSSMDGSDVEDLVSVCSVCNPEFKKV